MNKKKSNLQSASLEELPGHFLEWMRVHHYAESSLKSRRDALMKFIGFCTGRDIYFARQVTEEILEQYLGYLQKYRKKHDGSPLANQTRQSLFCAVRVFFRWLARQQVILADPAARIGLPGTHARLPGDVLTKLEVERIMALPDLDTVKGIRDRSILEMFYSTGIRRAELSGLLVSDVHSGIVFIRQGKGGRDRLVPVGERALLWVEKYLSDARPKLCREKKDDEGYLFLNFYGTRMTDRSLTELVGRYVRASKTGRRGACHLFRHTAATLMLENGAGIRYIQEMLGHESLETTQIYARVSVQQLRKVHRRTHPGWYHDDTEQSATGHGATGHGVTRHRKNAMHLQAVPAVHKHTVESDTHESADCFESVLEKHLEWMQNHDYSRITISERRCHLRDFISFASGRGITRPVQVTAADLEEYQKRVYKKKLPDGRLYLLTTQYGILVHIRRFFGYLYEKGHLLHNPAAAMVLPKQPHQLPASVLTEKEMEKILSMPDVNSPYGLRDRAVMELFYSTGMRRTELLNLMLKDVNFENRTVRINHGKGGTSRVVSAGERALYWLGRYLEEVRAELIHADDPGFLFLSSHGQGMKTGLPGAICRRYITAAGIEKRGSCHMFRHTAATLMLENGADIRIIQEMLGHKKLNTTAIYTHLSIRKLCEVHEKTHPGYRIRSLDDEIGGFAADIE